MAVSCIKYHKDELTRQPARQKYSVDSIKQQNRQTRQELGRRGVLELPAHKEEVEQSVYQPDCIAVHEQSEH